jgi:hypothetical protein
MSWGRPPPRIENMISLKVDNLTYRTNSEDLKKIFSKYGQVGDVYIPKDRFTRESRGFAFVRYPPLNHYSTRLSSLLLLQDLGIYLSMYPTKVFN